MNTINLAEAKAKLSELVTDAEYKGGRAVIARRNKPAAVVIGYDDFKVITDRPINAPNSLGEYMLFVYIL